MFSIISSRLHAGLRRGLLEGVEVHHHHVDRLDAVFRDGRAVLVLAAHMQNAAVHLGVQRLHAAVQHLGKAG